MRTNIINYYLEERGYTSYLEIGVDRGQNYNAVQCQHKTAVDPNIHTTKLVPENIELTSNEFFAQNTDTFDLVFIDGLHHSMQVYMDICNSLNVLNEGGMIVCHDMLPNNEIMQQLPRIVDEWVGDCWKAWAYLRATRPDLYMFVYDTDYGVGLIERGSQQTIPLAEFNWAWFAQNYELMNIKSFTHSPIRNYQKQRMNTA